uniref:Uncharacterized protein n=1 Tax=Cacopsylla melanoneura TaxID=428564 RepID=A0A8D8RTC1_9HEMI
MGNSYVPSSSLAYSSIITSGATVTSSNLSNVNSSVTTSSLFNSGLKTSTVALSNVSSYTPSSLSYVALNNTFDLNTSVVSSNTCSESSSAKNSSSYPVPYSSMTLYPPVTSSVTDFNLSTIFPEINDKNQNSSRSQLYSNPRHYQRSKSNKS